MEGTIGTIMMFGGNFAPRNWAFCDGQLLAIEQNTALFSILGTIYGGDGRTTFKLPELRGRAPVHAGQGPGLPPRTLGSHWGAETHQLTTQQMPSHTHAMHAENALGTTRNPSNRMLGFPAEANSGTTVINLYTDPVPAEDQTMHANSIANTGGSQSFDLSQPSATVNYIICLYGAYPSRS